MRMDYNHKGRNLQHTSNVGKIIFLSVNSFELDQRGMSESADEVHV